MGSGEAKNMGFTDMIKTLSTTYVGIMSKDNKLAIFITDQPPVKRISDQR